MQTVLYDRRCMIHPVTRSKDWIKYSWWDLFGAGSEMDESENIYEEEDCKGIFIEPQHTFSFRKRKRRDSNAVSDSSSVSSSNTSIVSEPQNKKTKRLSLAALFTTPMKPMLKIGVSFQGSRGGMKSESSDDSSIIQPRKSLLRRSCSILRAQPMGPPPVPQASPLNSNQNTSSKKKQASGIEPRQRLTRSWSQSVSCLSSSLTTTEVKRQEAIYELYSGEHRMVQDLELIKTTYRSSLLQLNILTEGEAQCIFGDLDKLLQLHAELRDKLALLRDPSGMVKSVGQVLMQWVPGLECYVGYCSTHVEAKAVLDEKKEKNKRFQDFLQRCLESPFSRKLDLWTFLDVPRSRLVKYPLLINEILRHTPIGHPDTILLPQVTPLLTTMLQQADKATGEAECTLVLKHLVWPVEITSQQLDMASAVLCAGELRDHRGTKLNCFLFDKGFLITRPSKTELKYTVCHPLIPACELEVDEVEPLRSSRHSRRSFRVSSADSCANANFVLTANDEHSKKRWMDNIKQVIQTTLNVASCLVTQKPHMSPSAEGLCIGHSSHAYRLAQSASLAEDELEDSIYQIELEYQI